MRYAFKRATVLGITVLTAVAPVVVAAPAVADGRVIGTVQMGTNSRLSAAIYDERGQLVRHLYDLAPRSGTVQLKWDGKHDEGYDVPKGKYNWRAATTGAVGSYDGSAGDNGKPVEGESLDFTENPGNATAVAYGPEGDLYTVSRYEETANHVRRYSPADIATGKQKWLAATGWDQRGHAVTADDKYVYNAGWGNGSNNSNHFYQIYRHAADTGRTVNWSGKPIELKAGWKSGDQVVTGLAVDATHLWVSDAINNQLRVYDKETGAPAPILGGQSTMPLTDPRGIVTDGAGRFWVVTGNEVRHYTYDATAKNLKQTNSITQLDRPYGLAWDRSGGKSILYVSEIGTGNIKRYNLALGIPLQVLPAWSFSNMAGAGKVSDTTFGWKYDTASAVPGGDAAIAVSPDGKTLAVVDYWNSRTLFYDTATATAKEERLQSNNNPQPDVDVLAGEDRMTSQSYEYTVDFTKPNAAHGYTWDLTANWKPTDDLKSEYTASTSVLRKINGNEYLYVFVNPRCTVPNNQNCGDLQPGTFAYGGVIVYRLNTEGPGRGMKRIAQIRKHIPDPGPRTEIETKNKHLTITNDTNGNGVLDNDATPGDVADPTNNKGYIVGNPSVSVDSTGTIWFANAATYDTAHHSGVGRLKVNSFDAQGDPVYRIADFTVPDQTSYDIDLGTGSPVELPSRPRTTSRTTGCTPQWTPTSSTRSPTRAATRSGSSTSSPVASRRRSADEPALTALCTCCGTPSPASPSTAPVSSTLAATPVKASGFPCTHGTVCRSPVPSPPCRQSRLDGLTVASH
ncbi:hypothetical protein LWC34_15965 [Kibdelosporangium philippinense]|uniref:FlgD/Vpr Ig-like domain-containing protein n=1 Tax=Kibdelosporangium philippinense TaxID=211113 RepID=A0ABS8Z8W6_9PSEU|nr:FlgD immunoglobulin-like domain containing protein [Kibdelosporangium philippinense]MCE7004320.1 hypothetical protein [Kibdelosporangium philippinense]